MNVPAIRLRAAQKILAQSQLGLDGTEVCPHLTAAIRVRDIERIEIDIGEDPLTIGQKVSIPLALVSRQRRMQERREQPFAPGIEGRFSQTTLSIDGRPSGIELVQRARNHPVIDEHVPANLQHRRAAVAARECLDVGLGRNHGHLYALPRQAFEPHHLLCLLRERRDIVLMQNQSGAGHIDYPCERLQTLTPRGSGVKVRHITRQKI